MTTYIYRVTWNDGDDKEVLYPTQEPAFEEALRAFKNHGHEIEIDLMESKLISLGQSPFMPVHTWLVDEDGVIY